MIDERRDERAHAPVLSRRAIGRLTIGTILGAPALGGAALTAAAPARRVPPAPAGPLRIGSNENPYGPGPAAVTAVRLAIDEAHRYPGQIVGRLSAEIASRLEVPADSVLLAPGSGEILRASVLAFTSGTRALVTAAPTFEAPGRTAAAVGSPVRSVPVDPQGRLDLEGMAAKAADAGLVFACNPNNPTGGANGARAVADFVARVRKASPDAVILVDEAYFEYVEDPDYGTAIPLTRTDPRVVVSRTFSKIYGMAGLRVGYLIGQPATLAAVRHHLSSGTLAGPSSAAALASLSDAELVARQRALNREARAFTRRAFEAAGFEVLPSEANFLMVNVKQEVQGFLAGCRERGVMLARPFPPLSTYARISIGTLDEMRQAVELMLPVAARPAPTAALQPRAEEWGWEC